MKIIIVLIAGLLSYTVIKVVRLGLKQLLNRNSALFYLNKLLLITEFIIWMVYIFWASAYLFREKFFYMYLILALMLVFTGFLSWFLMRDVFAGMIFRISHNLKNGVFISAGDIKGQIRAQNLTYLKLMDEKGNLVNIPYSRLISQVVTELTQTGVSGEQVVTLKIDKSRGISDSEIIIRDTLLNNPWSNLKEEPKIKFIEEVENAYLFEITLLSVNATTMKFIKMGLAEIDSADLIN